MVLSIPVTVLKFLISLIDWLACAFLLLLYYLGCVSAILSNLEDIEDWTSVITFLTLWAVPGAWIMVGFKCAMLTLLGAWFVCSVSEHVEDYKIAGVVLGVLACVTAGRLVGLW